MPLPGVVKVYSLLPMTLCASACERGLVKNTQSMVLLPGFSNRLLARRYVAGHY